MKQYERNVNDQLKKFETELKNEAKERKERNSNISTNNGMSTPVKNGNGDGKKSNDDLRTPSPMTKKKDNGKDDTNNLDESASSSNGSGTSGSALH